MSNHIITQRYFLPYFCTQFLGAFNDNVYKNALAIMITYVLLVEHQAILQNVALIVFILPFFLFSAIAGQLADKYEKSALIRKIKIAEIIIVSVGCFALYLQSISLMLLVLFLLGAQSTFFGPIKYSILPQHVSRKNLLTANGYVEAGTYMAILLGTILGGMLGGNLALQGALMVTLLGLAIAGWLTSRQIPTAAATTPELTLDFNIWKSSKEIISLTRTNKPVFQSILAISWFWFFGAIMLTQFPTFAKGVLYGDDSVATLLLATFSIGIALGSIACAKLSSGRIEIGLIPFGGLGISFFTWQLGLTDIVPSEQLRTLAELIQVPGAWWVIFCMTMMTFFGGLFIVPLYAFMQVESEDAHRSRVVAANNIINSAFIVVAGIMAAVMLMLGFSVLDIFNVAAILNLLVTLFIVYKIPEYCLKMLVWLLTHSVYRVNKVGLHHIPESGAALLVCNHASFADPAIILALAPRPIRFVMHYKFYQLPVLNRLWRALHAIPIAPKREDPAILAQAMQTIADELEQGNLVCLFPEGGITRNGEIAKFQPGIDQVLKRTPVPVVPLALQGMWGTWFSRHRGRAFKGFPCAFMKQLALVAGPAVKPEEASRLTLYEKVNTLRADKP